MMKCSVRWDSQRLSPEEVWGRVMIGDEFQCGGTSSWWLFQLKMVGTIETNQGKMGHGGKPRNRAFQCAI